MKRKDLILIENLLYKKINSLNEKKECLSDLQERVSICDHILGILDAIEIITIKNFEEDEIK